MSHLFARADAVRLPLPDQSCDLILGSPPYVNARLYLENGVDLGIARDQFAWVDWMLDVTREALRVTRGAVIWVCAGKTEDRNYWPAPEGLLWEAHKAGVLSETPVFWRRVGIPGSGGDQWFRKDVEYCLCFKRVKKLPWSDPTACGKPPKFGPGGAVSHRTSGDKRVDTGRKAVAAIANPGNLLQAEFIDAEFMEILLNEFASITGRDEAEVVRELRESVETETLPGWWCGVLARIHGEAILQSGLQRLGAAASKRAETGRPPASRQEDCPPPDAQGSVRQMRLDRENRGASQGRRCHEQRHSEPRTALHGLSSKGAQGRSLFGATVLEALQGERVLLRALLALQEAWRSTSEVLGQGEAEACGSVIYTHAGGRHLGHKLAHSNEAPFPEALAEFFIKSLCPPGGIVCDPFSGSATTSDVANRLGRHGIGFDIRASQCNLGSRRVAS